MTVNYMFKKVLKKAPGSLSMGTSPVIITILHSVSFVKTGTKLKI